MPLAPEYQAMLDALAAQTGPTAAEPEVEISRAGYRMMRAVNPTLTVGALREDQIPGPAGAIPVRIYTPEGTGPFPVYVNYHGGGWVIGDLDTVDSVCRDICRTAGCVVVSVDYRLAPEHRFPAAIDDAYAAVCWVADHMTELNGNGRLAVGGESAGGNLAAAVCLRARDNNRPAIDFQLLAYAVLDCDLSRGSYSDNAEGYLLSTSTMRWFWNAYCPDEDARRHADASPLRADSHAELPPAHIVVGEYDPLRDENVAYAKALNAAGVPAQIDVCAGLIHEFFSTATFFKASRPPFEQACQALRTALTS